jgi:hypothetical protein
VLVDDFTRSIEAGPSDDQHLIYPQVAREFAVMRAAGSPGTRDAGRRPGYPGSGRLPAQGGSGDCRVTGAA